MSEILSEKFMSLPEYKRLQHRQMGFLFMLEHLDQHDGGLIIETGTARAKDAWEGDGQSTLIWDWVISEKPGYKAISLDISAESCKAAREQVKKVNVVETESLSFLNKMSEDDLKDLRLLYLDSFDWSEELHLKSSFHHFCELASVWRLLPSGCMIAVDDRHSEEMGKHMMVMFFMQKLGIPVAFKYYQIGWIKP